MHRRILVNINKQFSKLSATRHLFKIPIFLLLLPIGLIITIIAIAILSSLVTILVCVNTVQYQLWRFSAKGRIERLKKAYLRSRYNVIQQQQRERLKFSQRSDLKDLEFLVKLTTTEVNIRKRVIEFSVYIETKRRLKRCRDDMNIDDALVIYSTLVDTELDLLNDTLNRLFQ